MAAKKNAPKKAAAKVAKPRKPRKPKTATTEVVVKDFTQEQRATIETQIKEATKKLPNSVQRNKVAKRIWSEERKKLNS